jgi:hypothetical protein
VSCKHCSLRESWRKFERRFEPPTPQEEALEKFVTEGQKALLGHTDLMRYLQDRGFTEDTIKTLRFGFCPSYTPTAIDHEIGLANASGWVLHDRILIPYLDGGNPVDVRGRVNPLDPYADNKPKYLERSKPGGESKPDDRHPYYPVTIDPEQPVVIAEGEFDAAILVQNGLQAVGVPGASAANPKWFKGMSDLYVAFDGDNAGRAGAASLIQKLPEVRVIELPTGMDCSDYIANFTFASFEALMGKAALFVHGKRQKDDRFASTVEDFSAWAFSNGALLGPKIPWAPRLEKALSGWAPGLHLIGAEANSGKSCFMVKACYQAAIDNPEDTVAVYLSLDDTIEEAMQRMVSLHTRIHFESVRSPRIAFDGRPTLMDEFFQGLDELKQVKNLVMRDATYGRSLNYLRAYFETLRNKYPDKKIVVFIDSLAKITPDASETTNGDPGSTGKTNWKAYLASELKYLTTLYKIAVVTPTDLRKLNDDRRPCRDDLKDAAELAYEANSIILAYNDVNRRRERATLLWTYNAVEEHPLFEVIIDKNKLTTFRGTIRYEFYGPCSDFCELTVAADEAWNQKVREEREKKAKED